MRCSVCGKLKKRHSKNRAEECKYVRDYVNQTQVGPFPVQFITVDPVVFFGDTVLLVRRNNHPGKGKMALPGGFVNFDERLLDAAIRECKEETNLELKKEWLVGNQYFDDPKRAPGVRILTQAFCFDVPIGTNVSVAGGDDALSAWWMPIDRLKKKDLHEDHFDIISAMITNTGDKKL